MNNITIIGNMVKDTELKYTQNGKATATNTVAVQRNYNKEKTDFINIQVWGATAEKYLAQYGKKGSQIAVSGELHIDTWKNDEGEWQSRTYINAREVKLISGKKENNNSMPDGFNPVDDMDSNIPF